MIKELIDKLLFGKKKFQYLFFIIHKIGLLGMNYGRGSDPLQSGELYVAHNFLKSGDIIFDIGGNHGQYLDMLIKVIEKKNLNIDSIHVFEPLNICQTDIYKKVDKNKNITIIVNQEILSESEGEVLFYTNKNYTGLSSVYERKMQHRNIKLNEQIIVRKNTIDNYCKLKNIDYIDFLKMDVEGHELSVLHGAKLMIEAGKIRIIQFEFGGSNIDSKTYFQDFRTFFLEKKYTLYRILVDGLIEIKTYKETDEIFTTINYLAVLNKNDKS